MSFPPPGFFQPQWAILPAAQKMLWPALGESAGLGFVLYGGTAIALRLGHRSSVDFDFFTEKALDRKAMSAAFPFIHSATLLQDEPNAFTLSVVIRRRPVKVSFFGGIGFGRYAEPEFTQDGVLVVAGMDDLLATKLKTILQRVESKDYRDIAAMLKAGADLAKGLAIAREMFRPNFQPAVSLKALTYFEGGDLRALTAAEKALLIGAAASVRDLPTVAKLSPSLSADRQPGVPGKTDKNSRAALKHRPKGAGRGK